MKIEVLAGPAPTTAKQFQQLWEQLGGTDPLAAHRAKWRFVAAGKPGAAFLLKQMPAKIKPVDEQKVARLVAKLDHDNWRTRQVATEELIKMGPAIRPLIVPLAKEGASQEIRIRAEIILKRFTKPVLTGDELRHARTQHAIDMIAGRFTKPLAPPVAPPKRPKPALPMNVPAHMIDPIKQAN